MIHAARLLQFPVMFALLMLSGVVVLSMSGQVSIADDKVSEKIVSGVVENTILVRAHAGNVVKLLELSDGNKYRLREGDGAGIGKGFKVELTVPLTFEELEDDVSAIHPNAILVRSIKITAIPVPGTNQYVPAKKKKIGQPQLLLAAL